MVKRTDDKKDESPLSAESLGQRWHKAKENWSRLLPGRIIHGSGDNEWEFRTFLNQDEEARLAAGYVHKLGGLRTDPDTGNEVPTDTWVRAPQPLAFAEKALADVAKALADEAVRLRISGSRELRQFERELRESWGWPSRNPSLLMPDVDLVVADVLHAMAADSRLEVSDRKKPPIDLDNDPVCVALRAILQGGPKLLQAIAKDTRSPSRTVANKRLRQMEAAGQVCQTRPRGPWRLLAEPAAR